MRRCYRKGDRVKVMDPWRGIVECFRGEVTQDEDPMVWGVTIRPSTPPRNLFLVNLDQVKPVGENRVMRWAS